MIRLVSQSEPVARKNYNCDACQLLNNSVDDWSIFTDSEMEIIDKARANGWKILKGEKHLKQNSIQNGDFCSCRFMPNIAQICLKYGFYDDY